jgi:hypothetical protein
MSRNLDDEDAEIDLSKLQNRKIIPDAHGILSLPSTVFFEDKPRLAKRFAAGLERHIIKRPTDAWKAMLKAGVRQLSEAVVVELLECNASTESMAWENFIHSRMPLFARVFSANDDLDIDPDILNRMRFFEVDSLILSYKLNFMNHMHHGEQEQALAHWQKESNSLYVVRKANSSGEVARELAFAACPDGSASQLASGFKEVLQAGSIEEAERNLDELGFPPGEEEVGQVTGGGEFGMGGSDTGDEWTPPSPTPPNPPAVDDGGPSGQTKASESEGEPVNPLAGATQGGRAAPPRGERKPGTGRTATRGRSRSDKVSRKIKQKTGSRMRSYVAPKDGPDEEQDRIREAAESEANALEISLRHLYCSTNCHQEKKPSGCRSIIPDTISNPLIRRQVKSRTSK